MVIAGMLIIAGGVFLIYNNHVENEAINSIDGVIGKVEFGIENGDLIISADESVGAEFVTSVDGVNYIGLLYVPSLDNLTVPIIDNYTVENLKISACRYAGSMVNNNMVVAGHNYKSVFGKLTTGFKKGDMAYFRDVEGNTTSFKCIRVETLEKTDVERMQSGNDWDLTLYTCNYFGDKRMTYRLIEV